MERSKGWLNGPMLMKSVSTAKTGKEINSWRHVSSASHQRTSMNRQDCGSPISVGSYSQPNMGPRTAMAGCLAIVLLSTVACDPLTGTGPGTAPDPKGYIHADSATKSVVITLIARHPAGDYPLNYTGYHTVTPLITHP